MLTGQMPDAALARTLPRRRDRLPDVPSAARFAAWQQRGLRIVIPGDPEWPTQLDDLGDARPLLLWLRGSADLRLTCLSSVSMVGSRAATGYGNHVAIEMAAALADQSVGIISGGPMGTISQAACTARAAADRADCWIHNTVCLGH